jgi:hypothetical protein
MLRGPSSALRRLGKHTSERYRWFTGVEPSPKRTCGSSKFGTVFGPMEDRWDSATGSYSFRFFSPEQIGQILREGVKRGRAGSHAAIERILKHEPGLQRAELWRQIRRLKHPSNGRPYQRTAWSSEDEQILRKGYEAGWDGKREAVRELLRRHPGWQPHSIWRRAARLGLVRRTLKKDRQRSRQPWTGDDDRVLLSLAGYKTVKFIAKALHRSESAIRYRLALLGKSSRVHLEGYSRAALARDLHLGSRTIQRLIVDGLLEVRDPRITRESLEDLCRTGRLRCPPNEQQSPTKGTVTNSRGQESASAASDSPTPSTQDNSAKLSRSRRAKRIWAEVAEQFNIGAPVIEKFISHGMLKLCDARVTEKSLRRFCARYGAMIKADFLDAETRDWLVSSMDHAPTTGNDMARGLESFRKHAQLVRTCEHCGRAVRGNAFFQHIKRCVVGVAASS